MGLVGVAMVLASGAVAMLLAADIPAIAAAGLLLGLVVLFTMSARNNASNQATEPDALELLSSSDVLLRQVDARPGNVLVCVRHPHSLAHVSAALQGSGDRDVVVMTVRLLGADVDDDESAETTATPAEQQLFSHVVALDRAAASVRPSADRAGARRLRRDRLHAHPAAIVGGLRRRVGEPVGRRPGPSARRGVGPRRQGRGSASPPRHLPSQRPHRRVSHRCAPAVADGHAISS